MIERTLKSKLIHLSNHFSVVAIHGARQVGKTTLARMIIPELTKPTIYLDMENPADLNRLTNAEEFFKSNQNSCVIIDEIQRQPTLFPLLRSVIDHNRVPGRFILLGSVSPNLIELSSETLAGRIVFLELNPFNILEIEDQTSRQTHWLRGGFPEPFLEEADEIRSEWFKSFMMTYIERDLSILGFSPDRLTFQRFMYMLAHGHGQIMNKSTFGKSLELSIPTITKYLSYLEYAYMIRVLPPFYVNLKKRLVKSPKVYYRDSGLLHHLMLIKDYNALLQHPILGNSWEGYIIGQITSVLGSEYEYFFYRTQDGSECDLVITKNFQPVACVEVKFTSTPKINRGLTIAIQDLKTTENYIVIPECSKSYRLSDTLEVCDLMCILNRFRM